MDQLYKTRRIDMMEHLGQEATLDATIKRLHDAPNTGGPFVIVDKSGFGPPRSTKADSLRHLRARLSGAQPKDWFDWHPDMGPQFRVIKMLPSMYDDPMRDANCSSSDIDAGLDLCFSGDCYAIGPGVVLREGRPSNTSLFGNDLSAYRITAGPLAGKVIYTAEHYSVVPGHPAGSLVNSSTVLYRGYGGCIEQGFATPDGSQSLAWSRDYQEGQYSRLGASFDDLMFQLGRAHGHPRGGGPISGTLPAGYLPHWTL
jgi:hypothetical protein